MLTRKLKLGLILCALMVSTTACSSKPCPTLRVSHPPTVYMQEVPEPKLTGKTNGDIASWAIELKSALQLANSDKAALRQWLNDYQALAGD